jgi:hypothetical protein
MRRPLIWLHHATMAAVFTVLTGCATTTVGVTPSTQNPVCDSTASALILWAPQWRPTQKDVPEREAAAETGLKGFLQNSRCFANSTLHRLPSMTPAAVAAEIASANKQFNKVVTISLRELGPVVKLLSSLALIEGGTEIVFQVAEYIPPDEIQTRSFTVHWQNGGPGVIKGVASLPQDMQAALVVGLQPNKPRK